MAVSVSNNTVEMTAAGDEFLVTAIVQSVRFKGEAGSLPADQIEITDPVTGGVIWSSNATLANSSEAELMHSGNRSSRTWRNGFRLNTLTGDRGTVYVRIV